MSTIRRCRPLFAATLLGLSTTGLAHITLEVTEAAVGSAYKAVVRVPHGCGTEATDTVHVQIPDGFYSVKPMPKADWTLETVRGDYAKPYDNYGTVLTEGVREIVWSGNTLPDEWYDEFVFRGSFADDLEPGTIVHFPTVQECGDAEEAWIDTTGGEDVEFPAPGLTLTPNAED